MAYIPPPYNEVDVDLLDGYISPEYNSVDAEMTDSGGVPASVAAIDFGFALASSITAWSESFPTIEFGLFLQCSLSVESGTEVEIRAGFALGTKIISVSDSEVVISSGFALSGRTTIGERSLASISSSFALSTSIIGFTTKQYQIASNFALGTKLELTRVGPLINNIRNVFSLTTRVAAKTDRFEVAAGFALSSKVTSLRGLTCAISSKFALNTSLVMASPYPVSIPSCAFSVKCKVKVIDSSMQNINAGFAISTKIFMQKERYITINAGILLYSHVKIGELDACTLLRHDSSRWC